MEARSIVKLLREARKRSGSSQADVGHEAGVAGETVSRMERKANTPKLGTVIAVSKVLGYEVTLTGPNVPEALREVDDHVPLAVSQLAARALLLDTAAQKGLLRLAQLLPVKQRK